MPHRQILGLDLLRFLAALMVTGLHLGEEYVPFGGLGVPIFFMLSGFVIAYSAKDAKPLAFAKSRVLRLMPGIWICATVTLALILLNGGEPATVIPRYLKTLVVWPIAPWIEGVYWTLPVEIVFYGVVFAVLIAGRREALPAVLMAIGVISTAYWAVRLAAVTLGFQADAEMYLARYSLMTSGCYFAIGGLMWACFFDRTTLLRLAAIGVFIGAALVHQLFATSSEGYLLHWAILLAAVAAMFASVRFNRPSRLAPAIRFIGLITYPLYLLHLTPGALLERALSPWMPPWATFAIATAAVIALSALVAATLEPFVRARLKRLLEWRPAALAPAS